MTTRTPTNVLFVPIKSYSERVPGKNFLLYQGRPLYQHFLSTVVTAGVFDRIIVDTDSTMVREWVISTKGHARVVLLDREPHLARDDANGNDLLRHHVSVMPNYDYYWQGFVTTPKISVGTVQEMVECLTSPNSHEDPRDVNSYDSIMTVRECKGFYWDQYGMPLNHRPEVMPRSQDLPPIYMERHGLFGIRAGSFHTTQTRAGLRPYFYVLPPEEDVDIDWQSDVRALK